MIWGAKPVSGIVSGSGVASQYFGVLSLKLNPLLISKKKKVESFASGGVEVERRAGREET
jgi:hypothetical protein